MSKTVTRVSGTFPNAKTALFGVPALIEDKNVISIYVERVQRSSRPTTFDLHVMYEEA